MPQIKRFALSLVRNNRGLLCTLVSFDMMKGITVSRLFICLMCLCMSISTIYARPLDEIKTSGKIKIGTADIDFQPVHYRDSQGNRVGIDIDIIRLIASKIDVQLEMLFIPRAPGADSRIKFLLDDEADLVVSNFSITPEREEVIDFSISYLNTGVSILLNNKLKNTLKEFDDLKTNNIKVALIPRSTQHDVLQKRFPNVELVLFKSSAEAIQAFFRNETDGYATDELFLRPVVSQNPDKYYLLPGKLSSDDYGVGVNKKYPDLRKKVSTIIEEALERGEIQRIIDHHTSAVKPPKPPQPSPPSPVATIHTVVKGDTLERIASKYYGKASMWNIIYEANKDIIPPTRMLKNGTKLKIPNVEPLQPLPSSGGDNSRNMLEYITYLYKKDLISKDVYDEIYEKGKKFIIESQLAKLKEKFSTNVITKEVYYKEQLALLRELF